MTRTESTVLMAAWSVLLTLAYTLGAFSGPYLVGVLVGLVAGYGLGRWTE